MTDEYDGEGRASGRGGDEAAWRDLAGVHGAQPLVLVLRTIGGNRLTCREFDAKKYEKRKAERSCGAVMGMA